jgi:hypothetical protein
MLKAVLTTAVLLAPASAGDQGVLQPPAPLDEARFASAASNEVCFFDGELAGLGRSKVSHYTALP